MGHLWLEGVSWQLPIMYSVVPVPKWVQCVCRVTAQAQVAVCDLVPRSSVWSWRALHCPAPGTPLAGGDCWLIPVGSLWRKGGAWKGDSCAWPRLLCQTLPWRSTPAPARLRGSSGGQLGSVGCKTGSQWHPSYSCFLGIPLWEMQCAEGFLRRSSFAALYSTIKN